MIHVGVVQGKNIKSATGNSWYAMIRIQHSMSFFKKYKKSTGLFILLLISIIILFFFLRIFHIQKLPIFTDEAIYVDWALTGVKHPSLRLLSLSDGKQPLFIWMISFAITIIHNPLISGRLVSAGSGFITMIGLFFLGRELFKNKWIGIVSALLYCVLPFALVYDRMALYDTLVGTWYIWILYFAILLVKKVRLDITLLLALIIGMGLLTKSSLFFGWYLLPTTLILFDFHNSHRLKRLSRWLLLTFVSIVLSYAYYSVLRLSQDFDVVSQKEHLFIYHIQELIPYHAVSLFLPNLWLLLTWVVAYMTLPVICCLILGLIIGKEYRKEKILLFLWFILPLFALALFGKVLTPRYILFMTLPLLPVAAWLLVSLEKQFHSRYASFVGVVLVLLVCLRSDWIITTDFVHAPIPDADLSQYISGRFSGEGMKEIIMYLEQQSINKKITVVTETTFGGFSTTVAHLYLQDNPNIERQTIDTIPNKIPMSILFTAQAMPTYLFLNKTQQLPYQWPVKLIAKYRKGTSNLYSSLYQVIPPKDLDE